MARKIKYLQSDILSVIAKEIELQGDGYQARDLTDEFLLGHNEYLLRTPPTSKKHSAQTGRHDMLIVWRTS